MRDEGISASAVNRDSEPVRKREAAEQLFMDVQRSDFEPSGEKDVMVAMTQALADLAPSKHHAALRDIAKRISESRDDDKA
jgi:hypothetical protein